MKAASWRAFLFAVIGVRPNLGVRVVSPGCASLGMLVCSRGVRDASARGSENCALPIPVRGSRGGWRFGLWG